MPPDVPSINMLSDDRLIGFPFVPDPFPIVGLAVNAGPVKPTTGL